jgi:hypothetical protein
VKIADFGEYIFMTTAYMYTEMHPKQHQVLANMPASVGFIPDLPVQSCLCRLCIGQME